jgi:hypothetical protein
MILNLSTESGAVLLDLVDKAAEKIQAKIPRLTGERQANAIIYLQHLGIAKHRLEYNLGYPTPFRGPVEWDYPLRGRPPKQFKGAFPVIP